MLNSKRVLFDRANKGGITVPKDFYVDYRRKSIFWHMKDCLLDTYHYRLVYLEHTKLIRWAYKKFNIPYPRLTEFTNTKDFMDMLENDGLKRDWHWFEHVVDFVEKVLGWVKWPWAVCLNIRSKLSNRFNRMWCLESKSIDPYSYGDYYSRLDSAIFDSFVDFMHREIGRSSDPEVVRETFEKSFEGAEGVNAIINAYDYCISGRKVLFRETEAAKDELWEKINSNDISSEEKSELIKKATEIEQSLYDQDSEMMMDIIRYRRILWD